MTERRLDPQPWRRCRCVSNLIFAEPLTGRCPLPATAEDGLCDHCRADSGPLAHEVCCLSADAETMLLDRPDEPCYEPSVAALAYMGAMEAADG